MGSNGRGRRWPNFSSHCTGPDGKRHMPVGPMALAFVAQIVIAVMWQGVMAMSVR